MVKQARKSIFKGFKVSGPHVDTKLGGLSRVPTVVSAYTNGCPTGYHLRRSKNAFMACIPGLDIYPLLTVDLLHEFELGVWKSLLIHILRILAAHSTEAVNEFDRR